MENKEEVFRVNEKDNQFELLTGDDNLSFLEYYKDGKKIFFNHTEVPVELRGHGVAARLVEKALQYCKTHKLIVVPACSYVAHYIDNHPEWYDILSEGYQM